MAEEKVCSTKVISPLKQTPCEEEVVLPPKTASFLNKEEVVISPQKQNSCMDEVVITEVVPPPRTVLNTRNSQIVVNTKVFPAPKTLKTGKSYQVALSAEETPTHQEHNAKKHLWVCAHNAR